MLRRVCGRARMTGMSVVSELHKAHRAHESAIRKIATTIRRDVVVPLCERYSLKYNVHPLGRLNGGSCFAFIDPNGGLIESAKDGRRRGYRMGRVFTLLQRNVDNPEMFGGERELGDFVEPFGF